MAKYERYHCKYQTREEEGTVFAELIVLFEDGDVVDQVIDAANLKMQAKIITLQNMSEIKN